MRRHSRTACRMPCQPCITADRSTNFWPPACHPHPAHPRQQPHKHTPILPAGCQVSSHFTADRSHAAARMSSAKHSHPHPFASHIETRLKHSWTCTQAADATCLWFGNSMPVPAQRCIPATRAFGPRVLLLSCHQNNPHPCQPHKHTSIEHSWTCTRTATDATSLWYDSCSRAAAPAAWTTRHRSVSQTAELCFATAVAHSR